MPTLKKSKRVKISELMIDDWFKFGGRVCRVTRVHTTCYTTFVNFIVIGNEPDPFLTTTLFHEKLIANSNFKIRIYNQKK